MAAPVLFILSIICIYLFGICLGAENYRMSYHLFAVYLSLENIGSKFSVKLNGLMVICAVLICSFDLFTHRKQIILSDYWRIAQPAVYTFTQDYNMTWLFDNAGDRKGSLNN